MQGEKMKDIYKNVLSGLKLSKKNIAIILLAVVVLLLLVLSEFSGSEA